MKLTNRQKAFCDYFLEYGNATEAARKAGYSDKTANRIATENLSKPVINEYIAQRVEAADRERIANADEVLRYLTSIVRGEHTDEIVNIFDGITTRARVEVPHKDRIKAAELLGKRYRLFVDRVEQQVDTEITIKLEGDSADWAK